MPLKIVLKPFSGVTFKIDWLVKNIDKKLFGKTTGAILVHVTVKA